MPFDKKGKHHLNTQKAMASDKSAATPAPSAMVDTMPAGPGDGVTPHTLPAEQGGNDARSILTGLQSASGGKHMLVSSDPMGGHTTHHINEDGTVDGPTAHADMESMKSHMHSVMGSDGGDDSAGLSHDAHPGKDPESMGNAMEQREHKPMKAHKMHGY